MTYGSFAIKLEHVFNIEIVAVHPVIFKIVELIALTAIIPATFSFSSRFDSSD